MGRVIGLTKEMVQKRKIEKETQAALEKAAKKAQEKNGNTAPDEKE